MDSCIQTHTLGYPRIGENRELKKSLEGFWKGSLSETELRQAGARLRAAHWKAQQKAGIGLIPSNDFSFYDHILDASFLVGNIPPRFAQDAQAGGLDRYFHLARGAGGDPSCSCKEPAGTAACEMTKWFDTNYHYIVPEFDAGTSFRLGSNKPFEEFQEALALGIKTKPVLIGPITYLTLGKVSDPSHPTFDRFSLLDRLLPVYGEILRRLRHLGAEWVQIDEPILALDLEPLQQEALRKSCQVLASAAPGLKILLASYFGDLRGNLDLACSLDCDAFHLDAVKAPHEAEKLASSLPENRLLSLGLVDGRNIWKNDFEASLTLIQKVRKHLKGERLLLASSCSLLHVPASLRHETALDPEIKNWLAFAEEKLEELSILARHASGDFQPFALKENQDALLARRCSPRIHRREVKERCLSVRPEDFHRSSPYPRRWAVQQAELHLPPLPTTTIGSFPQTGEVRQARAKWKRGVSSDAEYNGFLQAETEKCIRLQERLGLDVLVHGEFERNDMVEYFGEQLEGFCFTGNGWVQSYGSRCVKPPVILGDVSRSKAMTVGWSRFAQSLTPRPVKGMLTGPLTLLQWSFVRDDQPREETARQIALAVRDEVRDLEAAGIRIIQIDEPALREGLPLRREDWNAYLEWSTKAFRLASSAVSDATQIHTHMCYCEFNDIIASIAALDADVISIETSRSKMDLLDAFVEFRYPNGIGPGVWDIHSPRIPSTKEMAALLRKASTVLPLQNLWVNPDCGLKTRGWPETIASLENLVAAARECRAVAAGLHPAIP